MPRALPLIVALLAPAALVGATLGLLSSDRVLFPDPDARRLDHELQARPPDVLVLGNSLAGWGLDPQGLQDRLEEQGRERPVSMVWEGNAGPAAFVAMLTRVLDAGHRPDLVLVASRLDTLLATGILNVRDRTAVDKYAPSASLRQRLGDGSGSLPFSRRVERNRVALRERTLDAVKEWAVGTALAGTDESPADVGRAALLRAGRTVFEGAAAAPAFPDGDLPGLSPESLPTDMAQTLLPPLLDLAASHRVPLVFLLMPVSERLTRDLDVGDELERAFRDTVASGGGAVLDLRRMPLPESAFWDRLHLNPEGRELFTDEVARTLDELGLLDGSTTVASPLYALTDAGRVTRSGSAGAPRVLASSPRPPGPCSHQAPLPDDLLPLGGDVLLRRGLPQASPLRARWAGSDLRPLATPAEVSDACAGAFRVAGGSVHLSHLSGAEPVGPLEVLLAPEPVVETPLGALAWLHPGTTLHLAWDDPDVATRPGAALHLWLAPTGAGDPPEIAGRLPGAVGDDGLIHHVHAPGDTPRVDLVATRSTAHTALLHAELHTESGRVTLFGSEALRRPRGADLLTRDVLGLPTFTPAPAPRPLHDWRALEDLHNAASASLGDLAHLADDEVARVTGRRLCSPLQVLMGGEPLPLVAIVDDTSPRGWMPAPEGVVVFDLEGDPPARRPDDFRLGHRGDRWCRPVQRWWLYPGDVARFPRPRKARRALVRPATRLVLRADVLGRAGNARLGVRLEQDDRTLVVTTVEAAALAGGVELPLPEPLGPVLPELVLELELPPDGPAVLLDQALLLPAGSP